MVAPALPTSVVSWINVYHKNLPQAIQTLRDTLALYESGKIKDYKTVLQGLVSLYEDINAMIVANGGPDSLAPAKAQTKAALTARGLVK